MNFIEKLKEEFKNNWNQILESLKKDECEEIISLEKIIQILEEYKKFDKKNLKLNMIAITNSNPYNFIILSMQAINYKTNIVIYNQGKLDNVHTKIAEIINKITKKEYVKLKTELSNKDLENYQNEYQGFDIMCVDDYEKYLILKNMGLNVKYYPIFSIDLYSDSDEYDSIVNAIEFYSKKRYINLNIVKNEFTKKTIIKKSNSETSRVIIILTKKEKEYEELEEILKEKIIYINYNPFDRYEEDVVKQIVSSKLKGV